MKLGPLDRYLARLAELQLTDDTAGSKQVWLGYFPVVLVAVLGVFLTIAATFQSLGWEKRQLEIAFRGDSKDRILVVQRELEHSLGRVRDIASLFEASATVGRREFRKFVGPALKSHSGIKALAWAPVVTADERSSYLSQVRRSFPPYRITEVDPSGELFESQDRPVYFPVLYVQPYKANKAMLGLNLGADPIIAPLLQQAELAQTMQVSPGASIVNHTGAKEEIVVIVPVFHPDLAEENDAALDPPRIKGFAVGFYYIGNIVEQALASLRISGIDIRFYQADVAADGGQLLYTHLSRRRGSSSKGSVEPTNLSYKGQISVGNQQLEVVFDPAPNFYRTETWSSWVIFAGGLAFTTLMSFYVATLIGRATQVRHEVDVRTSQLWETVQALNREVTERKSAEHQLQTLNETLEHHIASRTAEADRRAQYLEQFAYVTSHDLKAPLRAVSNLAGWIEEDLADKLDDTSREQLALLRDRVSRMNNLIEGLLEYSRVGRTSDPAILVDTGELLTETIDSLSPPIGFKIKIRGEMPSLYADRLQLGQVFANLISNSLKHHGGDKGKIWITAESHADEAQFSVCDDGQGIAPEYHGKVFMMFQTLASGDFENSTGIGLALVKKIVEEHGGTIKLESALGEGTCIYFTWPNKRPADSDSR